MQIYYIYLRRYLVFAQNYGMLLENRNSTIYLKLKANYMLDQVDFSHFDYYKKENNR